MSGLSNHGSVGPTLVRVLLNCRGTESIVSNWTKKYLETVCISFTMELGA
jgi:hypothetical protein